MNIIIKETGKVETLSIIDPKTGVNYISDFIGNQGALSDGQFTFDENKDGWVADQATFDWWDKVVDDNQKLVDRVSLLSAEHGAESVYAAITEAGNVDLEDHAANINQALDDAFSTEKED